MSETAKTAKTAKTAPPLLSIRDLKTYFVTGAGAARAVDGVSLDLHAGETLGIVGESGSGKTVTSLSVLRLIPEPPGHIMPGSLIEFEGRNLLTLSPAELRAVRGNQIAMVFQEPMSSLNPVFTVGDQIAEVARVHLGLSKPEAWIRAVDMLNQVGVPDADARAYEYPHQLSGGTCQRVMIAMALMCRPKILIADEPTTALDVTVQAQILELLEKTQADMGMAVMLITHDLGIVAGAADRVVVMYAGQVVETSATRDLFAAPLHPYTAGLLASVPRLESGRGALKGIPGSVPPATDWPVGCRFHPRCPHAWDRCRTEEPPLLDGPRPGQSARCWLVQEPARRKPPTP
ncbi:MAG TPA: ABC transporter ATP-binding protein [Gemmatimonadales bacterium]|nr:ABC transporter ATP-binding protein [Gemmatimonadales bacterium]